MSVYGGFATRLQESQYSGLLCKVITLLERRVVSGIRGENVDAEQWGLAFTSVYKGMRRMEEQKYQPPKYSVLCGELASLCGVPTSGSLTLSHQGSSRSSRLSATKDWESYMQQYPLHRIESMLIEESKISTSPSRLPSVSPNEDLLKPTLRAIGKRKSLGIQPHRGKSRPLSRRDIRGMGETAPLPRRIAGYMGKMEELSEGSNRHRKLRKPKLAEIYQDRGYSKLFSELMT